MTSQPFHVLYVEDDAEDREIFTEALLKMDVEVVCHTANDGKEGLRLLTDELLVLPDFIFADVNMPIMNGKEFLKAVKGIPRLRTIPVIMYSTTTHPEERKTYLAMGARDVLAKPGSFDGLLALLSIYFSIKA